MLSVVVGYLIGSVPFAFLLVRRRGIDLRQVGSGNVGASNVLRSSGVRIAIVAMCLDAAKGSVAVLLAQPLTAGASAPVAAGLASVVGQMYPVWLGFRGGKGVATAAGVFIVLAPTALAVAAVVFLAAVTTSRYISLGSLTGATALAMTTFALDAPPPVSIGSTLVAALILHRHRANLARLIAGSEWRMGSRL